jgi:hypothetical protein
VLAFDPIIRTMPMTITRTTANISAYSATSCPSVFPTARFEKLADEPPSVTFSLVSEETLQIRMARRWWYEGNSVDPRHRPPSRYPRNVTVVSTTQISPLTGLA